MAGRRRIQNKVAESGLTLPAFSLFALCLWRPWTFIDNVSNVVPLLLILLSGYVLMEWCNRCQIIRVRSRLTTSIYVLGASELFLSLGDFDWTSVLASLGVVSCLFAMSTTYDTREPVVKIFHASLAISAVSVLCVPMLLLWPVLLFSLAAYMRVFSMRVLSASVLGMLLPWLFVGVWILFLGDFYIPNPHIFILDLPLPKLAAWASISLFGLMSLLHFLVTSYDDKIRIRMIFHAIVFFWVVLQAAIVLFPLCFDSLLLALWIVTCPLLSHHFALSSSRWTTLFFLIFILMLLGGAFLLFYE